MGGVVRTTGQPFSVYIKRSWYLLSVKMGEPQSPDWSFGQISYLFSKTGIKP